MGTTIPTLIRLEAGDPGVSIGLVASAMWLLGMEGRLADLASPEHDQGAIELDVRQAIELGKARAAAAAEAREARARRRARSAEEEEEEEEP